MLCNVELVKSHFAELLQHVERIHLKIHADNTAWVISIHTGNL